MKKIIITIVVIFILLVVGGIIYLTLDIPPVDDSDLILSYKTIPDEENAFYYFKKASDLGFKDKVYNYYPDSGQGYKEWNNKEVAEILKKNKESLDYIYKFLDSKYYVSPFRKLEGLVSYNMNTLLVCREAALFMKLKSLYLYKQGNNEQALNETMKIIQLGSKLRIKGVMLEWMIGAVVQGIGVDNLNYLIKNIKMDKKVAKSYISELKKYEISDKSAINTFKAEYRFVKDALADPSQMVKALAYFPDPNTLTWKTQMSNIFLLKILASPLLLNVNRTLSNYSDSVREAIKDAEKRYFKDIHSFESKKEGNYFTSTKSLPFKNVTGRMMYSSMMRSFYQLLAVRFRELCHIRATQILLALKAYKDEHGDLPDNLSALVPEYFSEIPKDPYDGQPIRYSKKDKIIYCVGKDLKDEGVNEAKENLLNIEF